jgi:hypothetical protein
MCGPVSHVIPSLGDVFTESSPITAGAKPYDAEPMKACAYCGASLADDQRYCLECGGRQVQARSQFLSRFTPATVSGPAPSSGGVSGGGRSTGATAVAGVGVLLLAMGVGVLIGRAGGGKAATTPAQVISVATPGVAAPGTSTGGAPAVTTPTESSSSSAAGTKKGGSGSNTGGSDKGSSSSSSKSSPSGNSSSGGSSKSGGGSSKTSAPKSKSSDSGESAEQKTRNIPNVATTG